MKKLFTLKNKYTYILYSILFVVLMFIMKDYSFKDHADDAVYQATFTNYSNWFEWAFDYYQTWSGRVAIHTVLIAVLNLPAIFWKVLVCVTILLSLHYVLKIAKLFADYSEENTSVFSRILLISIPVLLPIYFWHMFRDWTITWCTGTINYLLPGCCLLISLYPVLLQLFNRPIHTRDYVFALLAGILTSSSEQTGAIFLVYTTLMLLYSLIRSRELLKNRTLLMVCIILDVLSLISILAPGNQVRAAMEISWFQAFPALSLLDKLILGVQHYTGHMHRFDTLLFIVLMFVALFILNRSKKINELYVLLGAMAELVIMVLSGEGFSEWYVNPHWPLYLLWLVLSLGVPFYNAWLLYCSFSDKNKTLALSVMLLYLAAICSCVVLGFTPTIYASGIRAFFTYQLLMYVLIIILLYQIFSQKPAEVHFLKNIPALSCLVAVVVCIFAFIGLFVYTNKPVTVALNSISSSDTIDVTDVTLTKKNGFLQVNLFATDEACSYEYDNWVNGPGSCIYMNAKLFVKNGNEYIQLSTYPRPDEATTAYVELRGYIPANVLTDSASYELGIITYDLEGQPLGYKLLDLPTAVQ